MKCKGFTLIELVITIVILGIAMAPLLVMYGNIVVKSTESQVMRVSSFLGQDLMEEILSKRYDEKITYEDAPPWTERQDLGLDAGEHPGIKDEFDDVDDFIDWAPSDDVFFEGFNNYTAQVQVFYVNPKDLDTEALIADDEYTHFKKIIVTIKHRGSDRLEMVSVKQGY